MRRLLVGLLGAGLCVLAQAQAQTAADVQALRKTAQLTEWMGDSMPMVKSLCVQEKYAARWPAAPSGRLGEREYERLQQVLERCSAAQGGEEPERGLLAHAKGDFVARAARLAKLNEALQACQTPPGGPTKQGSCLQRWAGRTLSVAEEQELLALLAAGTHAAAARKNH